MKYQEALDIVREVNADSECLDYLHKFGEAILTLEELVEKEKVHEPILKEDWNSTFSGKETTCKCSVCGHIIREWASQPKWQPNYCSHCGQRIKLGE